MYDKYQEDQDINEDSDFNCAEWDENEHEDHEFSDDNEKREEEMQQIPNKNPRYTVASEKRKIQMSLETFGIYK